MRRNNNRRRGARRRILGRSNRFVRSTLDSAQLVPRPITISQNKRETIQMRAFLQATSNGSGVINSYISFDPSSTTTSTFGSVSLFAEWGSISALWQRCRLVQFEISCVRSMTDDLKGDALSPLAIASNNVASPAAPGSYNSVIDNGNSCLWGILQDYSGTAKYICHKTRGLIFAGVNAQSATSGAGSPGAFVFYGSFGGFTNATIFSLKVVGTYEFDTRT